MSNDPPTAPGIPPTIPSSLPVTLPAALDLVSAHVPDQRIVFPDEGEEVSYRDLAARSRTVGASLAAAGVAPGARVGILAPNAPEFLEALFGAGRAGAAAAPLALPLGTDLAEWVDRLRAVVVASDMTHLVVSHRIADRVAPALDLLTGVTVLDSAAIADGAPPACGASTAVATPVDAPALVQFTSGSTSRPKGVVLTHANVWHCARAITTGIGLGPDDVHGSWLPLFHDMGLFGALTGLFRGIPLHLWSPVGFVRRPARWLAAFAEVRATISTMPNFGYDTLLRAVDPAQAADLDLSAWRVAFNGAEAVSATATAAFLERFGPAGFRPSTMVPAYGMAEVTLVATLPPRGRAPVVEHVDADALTRRGVAVPVADGTPGARALVGLGRAVRDMAVRVAEGTSVLADGRVGEIQLRGAMTTGGYLAGTADGVELFTADGWLRSGDLGYLRAGELYFAGRRKEMITVAGRNLYPADVEDALCGVPGVHRGRLVALGGVAGDGTERIDLVVESTAAGGADEAALVARIRARAVAAVGALPLAVHPVPPRSIPRTTSGKVRRLDMRARLRPADIEVT